jgi:hypothetical protein
MRKILIIVLALFCLAWKYDGMENPAKIYGMAVGSKIDGMEVGGAASCGEIGYSADGGSAITATSGALYCNLYASVDCTMTQFTLYHHNTNSDTALMGVFSDDGDSDPGAGDLVLAKSDTIVGSTTIGDKTAAIASGTGVLPASGNIWICVVSTDGWRLGYLTPTATVSKVGAGLGAGGIPDTLAGSWGGDADDVWEMHID